MGTANICASAREVCQRHVLDRPQPPVTVERFAYIHGAMCYLIVPSSFSSRPFCFGQVLRNTLLRCLSDIISLCKSGPHSLKVAKGKAAP